MKKMNIALTSFLQALGTFTYVLVVVMIMSNGEKIFSSDKGLLIGVTMLMLFIVSAAICGTLVLVKPIMLYLDNQKKEALKLLYFTIGWLAIFTVVILAVAVLMK
jgi:hypothetical protein